MAIISPVSASFAEYTTPNEPLPIIFEFVYVIDTGRSGPWPGVARTVLTSFSFALPGKFIEKRGKREKMGRERKKEKKEKKERDIYMYIYREQRKR